MQYGVALGAWGLLANACFAGSFSWPGLSMAFLLLTVLSPVLGAVLTSRFGRHVAPETGLTFNQAFLHTLLMGAYAAIWVSVGVYIYLAYLDHGYIFNAYENSLADPAIQEEMERNGLNAQIAQLTGGGTPADLVTALRAIPAVNYAAMVLYVNILLAPFIAIAIALVCRKR